MATFIASNAMLAFMPAVLSMAIGFALLLNWVSSAEEVANGQLIVDLPTPIAEPVEKIMFQSTQGLVSAVVVTLGVLF